VHSLVTLVHQVDLEVDWQRAPERRQQGRRPCAPGSRSTSRPGSCRAGRGPTEASCSGFTAPWCHPAGRSSLWTTTANGWPSRGCDRRNDYASNIGQ
jgi:hypothetical protein